MDIKIPITLRRESIPKSPMANKTPDKTLQFRVLRRPVDQTAPTQDRCRDARGEDSVIRDGQGCSG